MKKLLIIIILIIITKMVQSNELSVENKTKINNYILTFQAIQITHNGITGFFIPLQGWNQLNIILRDYIYLQNIIIEKDKEILKLQHYAIMNFKLKTALGITIALDIGSLFLCVGLSLLFYNINFKQ